MKVLLATANVGGFDELITPVSQDPVGMTIDYHIFNEHNLPYPFPNLDNRLKAKYIKTQLHRLLPEYDAYVYFDGRVEIISTNFVRDMMLNLYQNDIVNIYHTHRLNAYQEIEYVLNQMKEGSEYLLSRYKDQQLEKELEFFKQQQLPDTFPLFAGGIFARWNNEKLNHAFDEWWRKCIEFSNFDQAMYSYIAWVNRLKIGAFKWDQVEGEERLFKLNKHK